MEIISQKQFLAELPKYMKIIKQGAVFVYPTDTIYGIGCDATHNQAVSLIRELKERDFKPFSVIAPSKEWIRKNCEISPKYLAFEGNLPGPYTLILKILNKTAVSGAVTAGLQTIGVRMPKHWIADFVKKFERPIVTTSVNISGEKPITQISEIPLEIAREVDFCIDAGKLNNFPSTIVDFTQNEISVRERKS